MFRSALILGSLVLGFSFTAGANTEVTFEEAKTEFTTQLATFKADVKAIEDNRDIALTRIDDEIAALKSELKACKNFDCMLATQKKISAKQDERITQRKTTETEVAPLRMDLVRKGKKLALAAFATELKVMGFATKEFKAFNVTGETQCGARKTTYLSYSEVTPSAQMVCRQLNLEFAYHGKVYKKQIALGLNHEATTHTGEPTTMPTSELNEVETIFSQSTEDFMYGVHPLYLLAGDSRFATGRPSWMGEGSFGEFGKLFYHAHSGEHVGVYTVATEVTEAVNDL